MTPTLLAIVAASFFVAGTVKGITGMGLPLVGMGLLSLAMPPVTAASLMIAPALVTNVLQCLGPHFRRLALLLGPLWIGVFIGCWFTPFPSLADGGSVVRILLGVVLIAYSAYGLARPSFKLHLHGGPRTAVVTSAVGLTTGMMTAATGINIFPMTIFLQALGFEREEMIQALGLSFTVCTIALAVSLGWHAASGTWTTAAGWIALVAAFAGVGVGNLLRARIEPAVFRRMLFALFGLLGIAMIAKELA
jgi:uncharacterized protein